MPFLSGYTKRKAITIDNTYVDGSLTDFPLLVEFGSGDTDIGADIDSNGYNLRFTSDDGITELDYEREFFLNSEGTVIGSIWVRVPSISSSVDTVIYVYYKSDSPSDGENAEGVWDSNFKGVWHLSESSGDAYDSTSNANTLTDNNTVGADAGGKVGGARDFERANSEQFTRASNAALQSGDIDFTLTAWVKLESKAGDMQVMTKYGNSTNEYAILYQVSDDRFHFYFGTSFKNVAANTLGSPSTGTWYFICAWHDATTNTINISVNNGATDSSGSVTASSADASTFRIGNRDSVSEFFDGLIDECRFSKTVRNADWRKFEYHNIYETDKEISFGSEEVDSGGGGYPDTLYNVVLSKNKWKYDASHFKSPLGYYRLGQSAPRTRLLERYPDKSRAYQVIRYSRAADLSVQLSLSCNLEYLVSFNQTSVENIESLIELAFNLEIPIEYGPPDNIMDLIIPRTLWKYSSSYNISPIGYWRPGQAYSRTQAYQRYPDKSRRLFPIKVRMPRPRDFTLPFDGSLSVSLIYNIEYLQNLIKENITNIEMLVNAEKTLVENLEYLLTVNRGDISQIEYSMMVNSGHTINTEWGAGVSLVGNYFNLEYLQELVKSNSVNIETLSELNKGNSVNIENILSLLQTNPVNLEYSVALGSTHLMNLEFLLSVGKDGTINAEYTGGLSSGKTANIENLIDVADSRNINSEYLSGLSKNEINNLEYLLSLQNSSATNIEHQSEGNFVIAQQQLPIEYLLEQQLAKGFNIENLIDFANTNSINTENLISLINSRIFNTEYLIQVAKESGINIEHEVAAYVTALQQIPIEYLLTTQATAQTNLEHLISLSSGRAFNYETSLSLGISLSTAIEYIIKYGSDIVLNEESLSNLSVNGVLNLESLSSLGVSVATLNEWKSTLGLDSIINIEFGGVTSLSADLIVNIEHRLDAGSLQKLLRWIARERKTLWVANSNGTGWTAIGRGKDWTSIER